MRFRTAVCADCGNEIKRKKDSARFKEIGNTGIVVRCTICSDKRRVVTLFQVLLPILGVIAIAMMYKRRMKRWKKV